MSCELRGEEREKVAQIKGEEHGLYTWPRGDLIGFMHKIVDEYNFGSQLKWTKSQKWCTGVSRIVSAAIWVPLLLICLRCTLSCMRCSRKSTYFHVYEEHPRNLLLFLSSSIKAWYGGSHYYTRMKKEGGEKCPSSVIRSCGIWWMRVSRWMTHEKSIRISSKMHRFVEFEILQVRNK